MLLASLFSTGIAAQVPPMAEASPLSNEELAARATIVVHGTVESIDIERVLNNLYDDRSYEAVLLLDRVERGEELEPGDRVRVRYWRRAALDPSAASSVAGFLPLPQVGTEAWLFATSNDDGTQTPILPNGWNPDVDVPVDPTGLYGGRESSLRDQRTASLVPWAVAMLALSAVVGAFSVRAGPQHRAAVILVAAGIAVSGLLLLAI